MYAIVKSGGRQERVSVGDVFELDRVSSGPGETFQLPALLLVDGDTITSDAAALGSVTVTAEVVDHTKGPKIVIQKYKNKTGYKKRQGHRQRLTQVKITGIDSGTGSSASAQRAVETAPVELVKPETVQPETVQPETVQPETVQPETVQPETVQPETTHTETKHTETTHTETGE